MLRCSVRGRLQVRRRRRDLLGLALHGFQLQLADLLAAAEDLGRGGADLLDVAARLVEVALQLADPLVEAQHRSEEHTSELQSLMRISYAVFCLIKKTNK